MRVMWLFVLAVLAACAGGTSDERGSERAEAEIVKSDSIDETLARHAEELMAHDGIQGIYVGETPAGEPCLVIMATVPAADLTEVVPDSLEGWPVRIESGDEIRPVN